MVSILNNSYILSRKNQMQLFYSPILGKGSCAVGIFTTGRVFAETSLGLFVSQSSPPGPRMEQTSAPSYYCSAPERCSHPASLQNKRKKQTQDMKEFDIPL